LYQADGANQGGSESINLIGSGETMHKRWIQFGSAVLAMIMIANLQYAWTLFVKPMQQATGWKLSGIQWALTVFLFLETWITPVEGWLIDRMGPRIFLSMGGLLCGFGWGSLGYAHSLTELYVLYGVAGVGAAFVYSGSIATALKWFPDMRGFASGLTTAAFGAGSALFIPMIAHMLKVGSYREAFLYTGIGQGILIILAAQVLHNPPADFHIEKTVKATKATRVRKNAFDFSSAEMLRTPHFYMLYAAFVLTSIGGLMITAQADPVARGLGIPAGVIVAAVSFSRIANGGGRLFWGWISDFVGREIAMFVPFVLQAFCLVGILTWGRTSSTGFSVSLFLVYFTWGSMFSLFPAVIGDFYGSKCATSNYGFLYTAKGVASVIGIGIGTMLFEKTGSWSSIFYGCAALTLLSAVLVLVVKFMPLPVKMEEPNMVPVKA
jgi:OFA family oxalate/formate antiporter-like MFS transporter